MSDDNNDDSLNDSMDPVIYYAMDYGATSTSSDDYGNNSSSDNGSGYSYGNGSGWGESSGSGTNMGDSGVTSNTLVTTNTDPQKDKIPMQKTGIPILPAELGIISIIGGFMINRIRS